jgi:hypothetical protein
MSKSKPYTGTTRSNGKYIRLTEMVDIINKGLPSEKCVSRETLLARIKAYIDNNPNDLEGVELIKQDKNSPKSPILVNYDHIKASIPSLMESDIMRDMSEKIKNLEEQMRIIYEVMYLRGFLRRD